MYLKHAENTLTDFEKKKVWHSKLAKISCPENKTRTVALLDYWSQLVLHMFQPIIDSVESKLSNSFMYDQDAGRLRVKGFTLTDKPVSLDGKDFTDRFHFGLQRIVMNNIIDDPSIVKWFFHILRGRGFKVNKLPKLVFYKIGQPMGANGSFQLANLTHCLFAIWCCQKATKQRRGSAPTVQELMKFTAVCGDDIVFKYKYHANFYQNQMQAIGVEFSSSKGFVSFGKIKVAEFCKRTYLNGVVVNGYSPRPASNFSNNDKHVFSFKTAYELTDEEVMNVVHETKPSRRYNVLQLLNLYSVFTKGARGLYEPGPKCELVLDMIDHLELGKASTKVLAFDFLFRFSILKEVQQRCFFFASPDRVNYPELKRLSLNGFFDFTTYQTYSIISKRDTSDPLVGTISEMQTIADPFKKNESLLKPIGFVKAKILTTEPLKMNIDFKMYQRYTFEGILDPYKGTMLEREVQLSFLTRTIENKRFDEVRFWFTKAAKRCLDVGLYDFS